MAVPEIIPIAHEPGYRTDAIGRYADGQFLASITYALAQGAGREGPENRWEERKRLFVVLHTFDDKGVHTDSDIWCAGSWAEQQRRPRGPDSVLVRAASRMALLLDALPGRVCQDIGIRPFRLTVDGVVFGLVTERHCEGPGEDDWAELYPDRLGFSAPWDGRYDT